MTAREFWRRCRDFDWFYEMSDDHSVWQRGEAAKAELLSHAPQGGELRAIWSAWAAHHYSGESFATPKLPAPDEPAEVSP